MNERLLARRQIVEIIIKELFTEPELKVLKTLLFTVEQYNITSATVYHDIHHLYAVVINSYKLGKYRNLSSTEHRNLFFAALFHDFAHSYGKLNDTVNVSNSISAFTKFFTDNTMPAASLITKQDIETITDAIFCTVFPFRVDPKNDIEWCLRKADLTMGFEKDAELFALGLTTEFKTAGKDIVASVLEMKNFVQQVDAELEKIWGEIQLMQWWKE